MEEVIAGWCHHHPNEIINVNIQCSDEAGELLVVQCGQSQGVRDAEFFEFMWWEQQWAFQEFLC